MLNTDRIDDSETLRAALDCLPDPVLIVDEKLRIIFANDAACALCGMNLQGLLVVAALRHPKAIDCLQRARRSRSSASTRFAMSEGESEIPYKMTVSFNPAKSLSQSTLNIALKNDSASDVAESMRSNFVANVSHELRSPLSALTVCADSLRNTPPERTEVQSELIHILEQETQRMNRLVNDLLSLSKLEQIERVRPTSSVNLGEILNNAVRAMKVIAESQHSVLQLRGESECIEVTGDEDQLLQVFTNLIENGLKYGQIGGQVEIMCYRQSITEHPNQSLAIVEVSDRGPGIETIHIPRLTERFYRVDDHRSRHLGGTGLGLAIVKHIVQRHRGRLSIKSELGKGSVFRVTLPIASE